MNKLTKAEEEIMQIIWQLGPCTVADIRTHIAEREQTKKPPHSSISTIVRILEKKQFLDHKAYGRTYEYHPIVSKEDYSRFSLTRLLSDYFEGSVSRLVSFMVKDRELSVQELSDLVDKLEEE
ncbi:MAG: BlaI/MecI/CopY family transcriptional regulator [Bacteroidota bacterium]